jgi:hypothetical protein
MTAESADSVASQVPFLLPSRDVASSASGLYAASATFPSRACSSMTRALGQGAEQPVLPRHVAMRWAQRLKRVFGIEIEAYARCGARLKVVASIEDPGVIARILAHRDRASGRAGRTRSGRCMRFAGARRGV